MVVGCNEIYKSVRYSVYFALCFYVLESHWDLQGKSFIYEDLRSTGSVDHLI
jgi:hypothetical protein